MKYSAMEASRELGISKTTMTRVLRKLPEIQMVPGKGYYRLDETDLDLIREEIKKLPQLGKNKKQVKTHVDTDAKNDSFPALPMVTLNPYRDRSQVKFRSNYYHQRRNRLLKKIKQAGI